MACGLLPPVQQFVGPPTTLIRNNLSSRHLKKTTAVNNNNNTDTIKEGNIIMETNTINLDQTGERKDHNHHGEGPTADLQGNCQMQGSNLGPPSQSNNLGSGFICSQLITDHPNNNNNLKASERSTAITTNNNSNSSSSGNRTTGGSSSTSNNGIFSKSKNSILKRVTKVVSSTDEEQEAFLAEIDSDLPNMLSRTFMGQDARFSFILFFSVFSFSLVLGLFVIQASYAWHNYQLLEMLGREDFSEEFFYLHYYDPPEPLSDVRPIPSLRVNTSFYVH